MRLTSSKRDPWFLMRVLITACLAVMLLVIQLPVNAGAAAGKIFACKYVGNADANGYYSLSKGDNQPQQVSLNTLNPDGTFTDNHVSLVVATKDRSLCPSTFRPNTITVTKAVTGDASRRPASGTFEICVPQGVINLCQNFPHTGGAKTYYNLPDGSYTVSETQPALTGALGHTSTVTYTTNPVVVPVAGHVPPTSLNGTITVTNYYGTTAVTGSVTVTKKVTGDLSQDPADYDLCVVPTGVVPGNANCEEVTVTGVGQASHTWSGLAPGVYDFSERNVPNGDTGLAPAESYSPVSKSVTVTAGNTAQAEITNAYGNAPTTGSVTVTKDVTGNLAPNPGSYSICLTPTGGAPDCKPFAVNGVGSDFETWSGLAPGSYAVTEASASVTPVSTTFSVNSLTVTAGGSHTATVTNAYGDDSTTGSATITKTVSGNRAPSPGDYAVCLTPAAGGAAQCKTLSRSGTGTVSDTWTGLAPGHWTLSETSATNGTNGAAPTTTITTPTVTVTAGGTATGSLSNDYGNNPINNNTGGGPVVLPTTNPRIEVVKTGASGNPDVGGTVVYTYLVKNTGDQTLTSVTLTDDNLGTLSLADGSLAPGASTSATATHVITAADLDAGSLTNVATTEGIAPSGAKVSDTDTVTVEFPARPGLAVEKSASTTEANAHDLITYTYVVTNTGNVTISDLALFDDKIGEYFDADLAGISLGAGDSVTVTMDYTVTKQDALAGSVTNVAVADGNLPRGLPPIAGDDEVTVPVTPDDVTIVKNTGFLTVSKQIDGTHEDKPYTFEVDCAGIALGRAGLFSIKPRGGDHEVGAAVPEGTECTVTETRDGGADGTTVAVGDGRAKSGHEATITIAEGTNLMTFTNTFDLAPIVEPDDPSKEPKEPKEKDPTLPATGAKSMMQLLIALASLSLGATLVRRGRPARKAWLRA